MITVKMGRISMVHQNKMVRAAWIIGTMSRLDDQTIQPVTMLSTFNMTPTHDTLTIPIWFIVSIMFILSQFIHLSIILLSTKVTKAS